MKKIITTVFSAIAFTMVSIGSVQAVDPKADLESFQNYFKKKFTDTEFADYKNGVYSIDKASREQWEEIEEFPPYEIMVDKGEELWDTKFANGKSYADCFNDDLENIRVKYPYVDEEKDKVMTLEAAINDCRTANGEKPFKWKKGKIAYLSSYIAYQGRGKIIDVKLDTEKAKKWYEKGKQFFYAKRGQLNMACADCHVYSSGQFARSEKLSPAIGHTTGFPVLRAKWTKKDEGIGTLHRRYGGCNKNIRAKPFKAQSDEYRALELFETYMSNGLELNGPSARK